MALLTKKQITDVDDVVYEDVPVPEWSSDPDNPDSVRIRSLSGKERSAVEATMVASKGESVTVRTEALKTFREKLVAKCLVGEDGERLFTDKEVKDLGEKNGAVLQRLFTKAQELSGMGKGAVEELAGKSEPTPDADSDSD